MDFHSILFNKIENNMMEETTVAPVFFSDLNLDQIVDTIVASKQEYNLRPFFYNPISSIDSIKYRQEVMRDLENDVLFKNIKHFADRMQKMRRYLALADKLSYKFNKEGWFLNSVEVYCDAINDLMHDLASADLKSRGLIAFRCYLEDYQRSDHFSSLQQETKTLKAKLASIKYCLLIKDNSIRVRRYDFETDYGKEIEEIFKKFRQDAIEDHKTEFSTNAGMNHVEARILDLLAQLYPSIFAHLDRYCMENKNYLDKKISVFDREIQFYVAYLEYISVIKHAGLKFTYPEISRMRKDIYNYEGFDLALAHKLVIEDSTVTCNDFYLKDKERIFVVSGPNQGGKTTFARMFGQLHYLASLGCPVPGREARLFLCDGIFTHFEKEEDITNLRGKLQDDLIRIYNILNQATPNSIIIMNEIFSSTTLRDGIFLSKEIMQRILELDLLGVYVTFFVELTSMSEKIVSMVSTIFPEDPTLRTYKIIRKPADGLAYAMTIAQKYRLTYDCLKERIKS